MRGRHMRSPRHTFIENPFFESLLKKSLMASR
jgi:hypothetical protein